MRLTYRVWRGEGAPLVTVRLVERGVLVRVRVRARARVRVRLNDES